MTAPAPGRLASLASRPPLFVSIADFLNKNYISRDPNQGIGPVVSR